MKKKRKQLALFPAEAVSGYARADAEFTLGAGEWLLDRFDGEYDADRMLIRREAAFLLLLTRMQLAGVALNIPWVEAKAESLRVKLNATGLALRDKYGIEDPGSRAELVAYFRSEGITILQTAKGNDKLDMGVLEAIGHPAAELIVIWRQCAKAIGTWCEGFLDVVASDGRIHPRFHSAGTISGRLSCTNPALQAVPMSDRGRAFGSMAGIFTAANGYELWAGDYSQAELRLATMYAACPEMAAIIASGEDVHTQSAQRMWPDREITAELRQFGKGLNFTLIYGGGVNAICEAFGIGENEARELKRTHQRAFPALHAMLRQASDTWKERGHTMLVSGRKRYMGSNEHAYAAFNQVIQGGVAEIIKDAMLALDRSIDQIGGRIVLQIFDSVEIEAPASRRSECKDALREAMTGACPAWLMARTDPQIALTVDMERWEVANA
jgi:DNA polymerase-1